MKATVLFFLLLAVTLSLASPQSGGPSAGGDKPDGPRNQDNVPSKQAPFEGLPTPAPFNEASKQPAQPKRDEEHAEPQVAEDPEIDSQTLEPPPPPKDPRSKRAEVYDEGRHRSQQKRRPSSNDPSYKDTPKPQEKRRPSSSDPSYKETPKPQDKRRPSSDDPAYPSPPEKRRPSSNDPSYKETPKPQDKRRPSSDDPSYKEGTKAKRQGTDEGRHRFEAQNDAAAAKRQFHTDVKRDDANQGNKNRAGDHFEKRQTFNAKRRGGPPTPPQREQEDTEDTANARKRDDANQGNKNRAGDHFEKRQKFSTDVKRDQAAEPTPQYKKPHPNRRADVPFYRPRTTVTEA